MSSSKGIIYGTLARIILVITTILIALNDKHKSYFIESDIFKCLNLIVFAVSNGYYST